MFNFEIKLLYNMKVIWFRPPRKDSLPSSSLTDSLVETANEWKGFHHHQIKFNYLHYSKIIC